MWRFEPIRQLASGNGERRTSWKIGWPRLRWQRMTRTSIHCCLKQLMNTFIQLCILIWKSSASWYRISILPPIEPWGASWADISKMKGLVSKNWRKVSNPTWSQLHRELVVESGKKPSVSRGMMLKLLGGRNWWRKQTTESVFTWATRNLSPPSKGRYLLEGRADPRSHLYPTSREVLCLITRACRHKIRYPHHPIKLGLHTLLFLHRRWRKWREAGRDKDFFQVNHWHIEENFMSTLLTILSLKWSARDKSQSWKPIVRQCANSILYSRWKRSWNHRPNPSPRVNSPNKNLWMKVRRTLSPNSQRSSMLIKISAKTMIIRDWLMRTLITKNSWRRSIRARVRSATLSVNRLKT